MYNQNYDDENVVKINMNTYKLLFPDIIRVKQYMSEEYSIAYYAIDNFTKKYQNDSLYELFGGTNCNLPEDKINYNEKTHEYEYKNKKVEISFEKISDYVLDDDLKHEITTDERCGKCHIYALTMGPKIENSKIVTGYITIKDIQILHTIIEYEENDISYILDFTKNIKIKKSQYIELTDFKEISRFNSNCVMDDLKILIDSVNLSIKTYVVFRNEIMNDLKRNVEYFKSKNKVKKRNK